VQAPGAGRGSDEENEAPQGMNGEERYSRGDLAWGPRVGDEEDEDEDDEDNDDDGDDDAFARLAARSAAALQAGAYTRPLFSAQPEPLLSPTE